MKHGYLNRGLDDVPVAETHLSKIDAGVGELVIGGFPVDELAANATYPEAVFLLFNGRLPMANELAKFERELSRHRTLDDEVLSLLRRAAEEGHTGMDALRIGAAAATLGTDEGDTQMTARRLVAVFPTVVAAYWRYRTGKEPVEPHEELGHAANYLYMLTGEKPTETEVRGLEKFLTTIIDHGLNSSTFVARVVASTESDLVSAATAAVGALKGTRHGGNLEPTFEMLQEAHEFGDAERYVEEKLEAGEDLLGFDHRVYRNADPRAAVLSVASERFYANSDDGGFLKSVRELEAAATDTLVGHSRTQRLKPTVELYATTLLHGIGVPKELFAATFGVSRIGGWMAHCLEQLENNELIRPASYYLGETDRSWVPIESRYVSGEKVLQQPLQSAPLEPVSETLATLSEPARLEILIVLYHCRRPITYSALRTAISIEDKGRFNYHLRQLREYFLMDQEDGYVLTDAGEKLVRTLVTDEHLLGNWLS